MLLLLRVARFQKHQHHYLLKKLKEKLLLIFVSERVVIIFVLVAQGCAIRMLVVIKRCVFHLDAVPRIEGRQVASFLYLHRTHKMFMQMIDILCDSIFERRADCDVVEQRNVLHVFAEPYAAGVRTNRHAKFCGHQNHGQHFVDARQTATIDLAEADRISLQELLEDDAVLASFSRGHSNGGNCSGDLSVTEHIIG